jgi:hypothetical protein
MNIWTSLAWHFGQVRCNIILDVFWQLFYLSLHICALQKYKWVRFINFLMKWPHWHALPKFSSSNLYGIDGTSFELNLQNLRSLSLQRKCALPKSNLIFSEKNCDKNVHSLKVISFFPKKICSAWSLSSHADRIWHKGHVE